MLVLRRTDWGGDNDNDDKVIFRSTLSFGLTWEETACRGSEERLRTEGLESGIFRLSENVKKIRRSADESEEEKSPERHWSWECRSIEEIKLVYKRCRSCETEDGSRKGLCWNKNRSCKKHVNSIEIDKMRRCASKCTKAKKMLSQRERCWW